MEHKVSKIFGAPGTGKTTFIIKSIEESISKPDGKDFAYVTFTKASARDFKERLKIKFGMTDDDIKALWVGTQHSICFRLLQLGPDQVIGDSDCMEFCKSVGLEYKNTKTTKDLEDPLTSDVSLDDAPLGNKAFSIDQKTRVKCCESDAVEILDLFGNQWNTKLQIEFSKNWKEWKKQKNKVDYVDMLEHVLEKKLTPPVSRYYFDEFQDYGPLQYNVYGIWRDAGSKIMIAGDDDQCIYSYQGAQPRFMLDEPGETTILGKNYRNAKPIYAFALDLIKRNKVRQAKDIVCVNSEDAVVHQLNMFDNGADALVKMILHHERTFILCRTNRQIRQLMDCLNFLLIPHINLKAGSAWTPEFVNFLNAMDKITNRPDQVLNAPELHSFISRLPQKDYIRYGHKTQLLKNFEGMSYTELLKEHMKTVENKTLAEYSGNVTIEIASPIEAAITKLGSEHQREISNRLKEKGFRPFENKINIFVGTIHSSKGLESDTVFLVDMMPKRVVDEICNSDKALEEERRVYYVAMTRAKKRLVVVYNLFDIGPSFIKDEY